MSSPWFTPSETEKHSLSHPHREAAQARVDALEASRDLELTPAETEELEAELAKAKAELDRTPSETLELELRRLDAGDRAALEDTIALTADDAGEAQAGFRIGMLRLLTVEKALVRWSLPEAPTPAILRKLDPDVLDAIFERVEQGAPLPPTPASA